jgi:2',3'-cyclic-nucleotide 2'-phosphodiesterase (5'-nucleotidase family)
MPRLRIVSINDVYTLENLPRLKTLIDHYRVTDPADAFIVTVAGDFVAPSLLSSIDYGASMVACMNALGVTHVTYGNHEDDIDVRELRARERELHAVWLATNVDGVEPPLPASAVIAVGPHKVGLVGVVMDDPTVYRRVPFGASRVRPANESALAEAARLVRDEGVACVVALTHQSADDDRALAREAGARIPLILGGHEHTPLLQRVGDAWIAKSGSDAVEAIVAEVLVREDGTVEATARLEPVAPYREDIPMRARIEVYSRKVRALEAATLFVVPPGHVVSSIGTRSRQTTLGTAVCTRLRDALGADAALFNGGGIRGNRDHDARLTYGDIEAELPFDNEIVVQPLSGAVLRDAVAMSRAHAPAESAGFLQVDDGMRVDEPGHTLVAVAGAPFDAARIYRVALVREMLFGLDRNEPLVAFARAHPDAVVPPGCGREAKLVLVESFVLTLWKELGGLRGIDENLDGVATEAEVQRALARLDLSLATPAPAELIVRTLDRDHDDVVSGADVGEERK